MSSANFLFKPADHVWSQNLAEILAEYQEKYQSDPNQLRHAISATEIWRFFTEDRRQRFGFGLSKLNRLFEKEYDDFTLLEYINKIEKTQLENSQLLKKIKELRWCLSSEQIKIITPSDLFKLDQAWLPFENSEPGYYAALYSAFHEIFCRYHSGDTELSLSFIKMIHMLSVRNVKNIDHGEGEANNILNDYMFRKEMTCCYQAITYNASVSGLCEFIQKKNKYSKLYIELSSINCSICLDHETIEILRNNKVKLKQLSLNPKDYPDLLVEMLSRKMYRHDTSEQKPFSHLDDTAYSVFLLFLCRIAYTNNDFHVAECVYQSRLFSYYNFIKLNIISLQRIDPRSELECEMRNLVSDFNLGIQSAKMPVDKLSQIVSFIQSCEQLHPFGDANCRTFCMILLNYLLISNGFPLSMMNDPNQFDLFSHHQLVTAVMNGMKNTFRLISEGELFNVKTNDVLSFLQSKPIFEPELNCFKTFVNIEIAGRNNRIPRLSI